MHRAGLLCNVFALAISIAVPMKAQTVMGTILGSVRDSDGAVVPDAQVSLQNPGTGLERQSPTNEQGEYNATDLPVGTYRLSVSKPGFKTEVRNGITLTIGATIPVNVTLRVGDVKETVEVTADAAQVETATSSMGGLVGEQTIRELPLNGRDWLQLTTLEPGVSTGTSAKDGSRGWGTSISVNGARANNVAYRVDGLVVNDMSNAGPGSILGVNLGVDAIQEYKVLTSTYSAEFGRSGGGVVNAALKSGTNAFHGGVFEFLRNSALDARSFFDPSVLPFRRNQYGGSVGGPIKRNKLFFFTNYEVLTQVQSRTSISQTLTDAARRGHLQAGDVPVSSVIQKYLPLYPSPNGPISGDTGQYIIGIPTKGGQHYAIGKVDYAFSTQTNLSVAYNKDWADQTSPDAFFLKKTGTDSATHMASATLTHSFSPRLFGTTHAGVYRHHDDTGKPIREGANPLLLDTSLGFLPNAPMGTFAVTGLTNQSGVNVVATSIDGYTSPQGSQDFYWTKGRHSLKFGGNIERIQSNEAYSVNNLGQWTFTSVANFLQAKPSALTSQTPTADVYRGMRMTVAGGYLQDDFRWSRRLTLNLGVRYETSTVITESNNKIANLVNLTDKAMTIGGPLYKNPTLRNFAPRVGVAWDVTGNGKTALRAGFGMFDLLPLPYVIENRIDRTYPFYDSITLSPAPAAAFPNNFLQFVAPSTARVVSIESNPRRSYMLQFNANVERQLAKDLALTIGYAGSAGVHLPVGTDDADVVPLSFVSKGPNGELRFPTGPGTPQRINPTWGRISTIWWEGHSTYHSLLASLTRRYRNGTAFQVSYRWAHLIDDGDGTYSESQNSNSAVTPYPLIWSLQRGNSDFDVRHNLVASYSWVVPTPTNWHGATAYALSGWQLGGILTARTGLPASAVLSNDQANTGTSSAGSGTNPSGQRPNYNPAGCANGVTKDDIYSYLNLSCFSYPVFGTIGNLGRGTIPNPVVTNFDLSLSKNFPVVGERLKGQFRAEAFNILNHASFALNRAQVFSGTGQLVPSSGQLNVVSSGRVIQLGIKLEF